jgi:2-keto-4-pentenoate hydratase/2-oxohepta-3-ene-1,7-dioic acid hydratase in catechol pathway
MKLVTFLHEGIQKIGAVVDDQIIDFSTSHLPKSMIEFIELGDDGINQANALIAKNDSKISINDVKLMAPIPKPNKILGVGLNYKAHKEEAAKAAADLLGKPQEKYPTIFNKQNSSVVGPYDDMHKPDASDFFDYEGELGFVIGKQCRHVPYDKASSVIYGYTVVNDATIRDWQMRGPPMTMTMGKSWDTHCPFGPYLVTSDEVGNPHQLKLETHVNGELRQSASTDGLIHDCFTVVEYLSTAFTLEPGDLIATGTPEGVAATSRNWLKVDDVVKVTIEKLGFIENKVISEPDSTASY